MKQNETILELSRIKRLKESLPVEDGRQIDLYSGILEKNEKKNLVYFGLENELNLKKALEDKNRSYKVSNKMTKLFTIPQTNASSKFIGSLVEDDIYKNYCITKSNRLENYVNKIEERRMKIIQAQKQQVQNNLQTKNATQKKNGDNKKSSKKNNTSKNVHVDKSNKVSTKAKAVSNKINENNNIVIQKSNTKSKKTLKVNS